MPIPLHSFAKHSEQQKKSFDLKMGQVENKKHKYGTLFMLTQIMLKKQGALWNGPACVLCVVAHALFSKEPGLISAVIRAGSVLAMNIEI